MCKHCLKGEINLCEGSTRGQPSTAYGISPALNGGHAEYMEVPFADTGAAKFLTVLPTNKPFC